MIKLLFAYLFLCSLVFSQAPNSTTPSTPAQPQKATILDGLGDVAWESSFTTVREKFKSLATNPDSKEKIEIVNEVKDKSILIKRNGINYYYRFYKTPEILSDLKNSAAPVANNSTNPTTPSATTPPSTNPASTPTAASEGRLFSVGIIFNFVESELLKNKITSKYGKPTSGDSKEPGAIIWELTLVSGGNTPVATTTASTAEVKPAPANAVAPTTTLPAEKKVTGGYIIQWGEPYNKKVFTRRLDYYSANLKNLIEKEYKEYFSVIETKTIMELLNEKAGSNSAVSNTAAPQPN